MSSEDKLAELYQEISKLFARLSELFSQLSSYHRIPGEIRPVVTDQYERVVQLRDPVDDRIIYGHIYLTKDGRKGKIVPNMSIKAEDPAITRFLIAKILERYSRRDLEEGARDPFKYQVVRDGDILKEIILENISDRRLKELRSAARWAFSKAISR